MGNPLFGGRSRYGIKDVVNICKQARQNPSMLGNLLYQNGRIDQNQMNAMQGMSPQQMVQYMQQNGIMNQQFVQNGQQFSDPVKRMM